MIHTKKTIFTLICCLLIVGQNALQAQYALPRNAVPGKCYAKCYPSDSSLYDIITDRFVTRPAHKILEIVPAIYETIEEQILIKEAYEVLAIEPPKFTPITEKVKIKEASSRLVYTPPVFSRVAEQVMIIPTAQKWTKGRANRNCLTGNPTDCKVWCLTEIPAQYRTIYRQVLTQPASVQKVLIPAEYKTMVKAIVETASEVQKRMIPAKYRTVQKQKLVHHATTKTIEIPVDYGTYETNRMVRFGCHTDWVEVDCATVKETIVIPEKEKTP